MHLHLMTDFNIIYSHLHWEKLPDSVHYCRCSLLLNRPDFLTLHLTTFTYLTLFPLSWAIVCRCTSFYILAHTFSTGTVEIIFVQLLKLIFINFTIVHHILTTCWICCFPVCFHFRFFNLIFCYCSATMLKH